MATEEEDYFSIHKALEESLESEDSQLDLIQSIVQGVRIAEKLTDEHIRIIKEKFLDAPDQSFSKLEFQNVLEDVNSNITFPNEEEFTILFKKMDYKRDERIDWDEFVTYLLLEFQEKDATSGASTKALLEPPISGSIKIVKSGHRHPVVRITYCPTVDNDRQMNYHNGKYLTASKDGVIHYWSLDMVLERTVFSTCPELKVNSTWVTDMICMPDINIVCTSSTERDLRFYDTTAKKFELRVMITSLENAVRCMDYYFSSNIAEDSKLILGDMGGSVHILCFNSESRGPFRQKPGIDVIHLRYEAVLRGQLLGLKVISFLNVHHDWVCQVAFYPTLKSFISCCSTPDASMIICDIGQTRKPYTFNVPSKGISCFSLDDDIHMVVTGGSDCLVRVWNPFVPVKASSTFKGHHAAICGIIIQKESLMLYTLSKDRCVKVWHTGTQTCIQTFTGLSNAVGVHQITPITTYYNPERHTLMVAGMKIALLICNKVVNEIYTDGYTHTKPVTKAMYNPLFKCLVTIGMDSCIMVWDPFLGRRIFLVKRAHTQMLYGDIQEVEITAGTFDPTYTLLLTGARDGTLKIWNFNTGTCIRNMSIEKNCRVTNVIWIPNRILAVGWNRHVTEFADSGNVGDGKHWETRHTEDILASCIRPPQALVTSSYHGELIFWRLETGQPYKKFFVSDPEKKHAIVYTKEKDAEKQQRPKARTSAVRTSLFSKSPGVGRVPSGTRESYNPNHSRHSMSSGSIILSTGERSAVQSNLSLQQSEISVFEEELPVHATLFLTERPMEPNVGTLLVSLENSIIQIWSHHKTGGIIAQFNSLSGSDDFVITMATDAYNIFLFTGDTSGYIKIWLMTNFGVPLEHHIDIDVDYLKKNFSYFARRYNLNQNIIKQYPILLSTFQGHTMTVTHIEYLTNMQIIISCSVDKTVRFWNLRSHYIGTLGSLQRWIRLVPDQLAPQLPDLRVPPDIRRIASESTLKVLEYNYYDKHDSIESQQKEDLLREQTTNKELSHSPYGSPVVPPILGKYFELPHRGIRRMEKPKIDVSVGPSIQVYAHMRTYQTAEIKETAIPASIVARVKPKIQKNPLSNPHSSSVLIERHSSNVLGSRSSSQTGSPSMEKQVGKVKSQKEKSLSLPNSKGKDTNHKSSKKKE